VLKQRLLTALLLIPLFVWLVLGLPTAYIALLFALIVLLGAMEWAALFAWQGKFRYAFLVYMATGLGLCYLAAGSARFAMPALLLITLAWTVLAVWLWRRRDDAAMVEAGLPWCHGSGRRWALAAGVLWGPYLALMALHGNPQWGPAYMLFCLTLMWVADSAAYFAGRRFGRNKLATAISPGKSWEGVAGALLACAVWAWLGTWWLAIPGGGRGAFVVLCLVVVALSVVGDLFESQLKRGAHVKDSGGLLPGHGGVLDRIDSTTAGAPAFVVGLWLLG
jgi:phosphatidate cytidylyltransferase